MYFYIWKSIYPVLFANICHTLSNFPPLVCKFLIRREWHQIEKNSFKIVESRIFCVNFYQNCRFSLLFRYSNMIIVHISSSHSLGDSKETTSFKTLSISERWIRMIHHLYRECIANPHNVLFFSLVDCTITVIAFIFFSFCVPIYRVFLVNSLLFVSVSISLFWLLLI